MISVNSTYLSHVYFSYSNNLILDTCDKLWEHMIVLQCSVCLWIRFVVCIFVCIKLKHLFMAFESSGEFSVGTCLLCCFVCYACLLCSWTLFVMFFKISNEHKLCVKKNRFENHIKDKQNNYMITIRNWIK